LLVVCGLAYASNPVPDTKDAPAGGGSESLAAWKWMAELPLPAEPKGRWYDFLVPPEVLDKGRPDLDDLRLRDARGREVPYERRIRQSIDTRQALTQVTELQKGKASDRSYVVKLDLGAGAVPHNEIEIVANGRPNFLRKVELQASDKPDGDWLSLCPPGELIRLQTATPPVNQRRFPYPTSRARYVRIQVFPGPALFGEKEDTPEVESVTLFRTVRRPGLDQELPARLGGRENVPTGDGPGSAWSIEFDRDMRLPVDHVTINASDEVFERRWRLEVANQGEWPQPVNYGDWRRRGGEDRKPLEIDLRPEVTASRLRFVVTDYRNQPLTLTNVRCTAAARQVIFDANLGTDVQGPLHVYVGNPHAGAPNYDRIRLELEKATSEPVRLEWGNVQLVQNPDYHPAPLPLSERLPWLVYVVLGVASVVLLLLLGALAKQAMAQADSQAAQPQGTMGSTG
jgi:hypothetical protein